MSEAHNFYLSHSEPNRGCLLAMQKIILNQHAAITETRKYGMPCFCYKGKPFCYLWVAKKENTPYFLLVEGKRLQHPKLETGDRSRMKILRVDPNADLPVSEIEAILTQALELYKK